ncbi:MAG: potassium-transporting ATPase subunit KdpC [Candidatus Eremiobacterota bacterium]
MIKQIKTSFLIFIIFSVITGLIYPLSITAVAQIAFPYQAKGSVIKLNGKVIGSELIGQNFSKPEYFHGRPSAVNYDGRTSGGSNFGPVNKKLIDLVDGRIKQIEEENKISSQEKIPADLVLASASGLDPHISPASAMIQVKRVAGARGLSEKAVNDLIKRNTDNQFLGQQVINVLKLNIDLDKISSGK